MKRRGYTVVELLMAITLFAIGVAGIIALQKVTSTANRYAKNLAIATHIAQGWQEQLQTDSVLWNFPNGTATASDLGDTVWLQVIANKNGSWIVPVTGSNLTYDANSNWGAAFDPLGRPIAAGETTPAAFCTHIRLTRLYSELAPNGLIRSEVRVFWLQDGQNTVDGQALCNKDTDAVGVGNATARYHFVYATSAVRQNTAP